MALRTDRTFNDLPVCPKCGWPMAGPLERASHHGCPYVEAGDLAVQLAERFPELSSTKFGYGDGQLTFELDKGTLVRFSCSAERFCLEEIWLLDDLTPDEAAGLVKAISEWRSACLRQRDAARVDTSMTDDEISAVRDGLLGKNAVRALSVPEQNLLRDCNYALGRVRCTPRVRAEARAKVARAPRPT